MRAALNGLLIRLRKQQRPQSWPRVMGAQRVLREPGTGRFPGRQERLVAVTGLAPAAVGTIEDSGLSPVTEAKSRANALDRRER